MTRGERNNNPGNIRIGQPWQGLATDQADPDFCQFTDPTWGIRAIAKILHSYAEEGVMTLRQAINHWAPSTENDTVSYVADVSAQTGIQADITISLMEYDDVMPIVKAIIYHENGEQPYPQSVVDAGLALAGVVP